MHTCIHVVTSHQITEQRWRRRKQFMLYLYNNQILHLSPSRMHRRIHASMVPDSTRLTSPGNDNYNDYSNMHGAIDLHMDIDVGMDRKYGQNINPTYSNQMEHKSQCFDSVAFAFTRTITCHMVHSVGSVIDSMVHNNSIAILNVFGNVDLVRVIVSYL
jgi:hypothetical protein